MKVFIIIEHLFHSNSIIHGIFDSEEKALAELDKFQKIANEYNGGVLNTLLIEEEVK